jgi:hypothetical protein
MDSKEALRSSLFQSTGRVRVKVEPFCLPPIRRHVSSNRSWSMANADRVRRIRGTRPHSKSFGALATDAADRVVADSAFADAGGGEAECFRRVLMTLDHERLSSRCLLALFETNTLSRLFLVPLLLALANSVAQNAWSLENFASTQPSTYLVSLLFNYGVPYSHEQFLSALAEQDLFSSLNKCSSHAARTVQISMCKMQN